MAADRARLDAGHAEMKAGPDLEILETRNLEMQQELQRLDLTRKNLRSL